MDINRQLYICRCNSIEHQLVFTTFPYDDDDNFVYATIHLRKLGFWERLVNAIKYLFGHTSVYGDFEEFIFNEDDADKLQQAVDYLKACKTTESKPTLRKNAPKKS